VYRTFLTLHRPIPRSLLPSYPRSLARKNHTSNPSFLKHFTCASINARHRSSSSPRATTHSSRAFFVVGHAQHIFFGFPSCPSFIDVDVDVDVITIVVPRSREGGSEIAEPMVARRERAPRLCRRSRARAGRNDIIPTRVIMSSSLASTRFESRLRANPFATRALSTKSTSEASRSRARARAPTRRFEARARARTRSTRVFARSTSANTFHIAQNRVSTHVIANAALADGDIDVASASFDWRAQWYPACFASDVERDAPYQFTLLGEPLVFWRDNEGVMQCVRDRCPHRAVPLSEGRVNEKGELECGYHGWTFTGRGACTGIPQIEPGSGLDTALKSPRSCVTSYNAREAQGMVWVFPVARERAPATLPDLPLVPEYDDPDCVCQDIFRDLPMDWGTLLENVMDVSHVPFTHHKSVGNRENATPVNLELTSAEGVTARGFQGVWKEGPRRGKYGTQYTEFQAPTLMRHTLRTPSFTTLTVVYAVPTTPGRCRLLARFPFIFKAALPRFIFGLYPQWFSHTNQNAILEDDQIFLHKQERLIEIDRKVDGKSYAQSCYMPTKADVYVSAFRKWVSQIAGGGPAWPKGMDTSLPPQETSREALLDRYHSHTKNCKSCATALANIGRARKALRVLTFVALAVAVGMFARSFPTKPTVAVAILSAAFALIREKLGALAQKMIVGPYPPPRRPPSMMESALQTARWAGAAPTSA